MENPVQNVWLKTKPVVKAGVIGIIVLMLLIPAMIGLALVLFYTLLLSFSEYLDFNISYGIASLCTIGLIAWFVKGLLRSAKLGMLLSLVLLVIYTYLFTILQLQDYSLLLGSIGLFIMLAVIMHFSKKVQW